MTSDIHPGDYVKLISVPATRMSLTQEYPTASFMRPGWIGRIDKVDGDLLAIDFGGNGQFWVGRGDVKNVQHQS